MIDAVLPVPPNPSMEEVFMGVYQRKNRKTGKPSGKWIIQYPHRSVEIPDAEDPEERKRKIIYKTETVGFSKRLAERRLAERLAEWEEYKRNGYRLVQKGSGEGRVEYSFEGLVDWYLELPKVRKKLSYEKDVERGQVLKKHFGGIPAEQIKPSMVEAFQYKMLEAKYQRGKHRNGKPKYKKCSPATVNRTVALMKRVYNLAIRDDLVEKNPCFKVEMLDEDNKRERDLSQEEYQALKEELPEHLRPIVIVAYHTGLRRGDLLELRRHQVRLEGEYRYIEPDPVRAKSKVKPCGEPPITEEAVQALKEAMKLRSLKYDHVFLYRGKPLKDISVGFNDAVKRAGIKDFRFHDLRHCAVSNMRRAGLDPSTRMRFTGHKTLTMDERYNTVKSVDRHEALGRLNRYFDRQNDQDAIHCKSTASDCKAGEGEDTDG